MEQDERIIMQAVDAVNGREGVATIDVDYTDLKGNKHKEVRQLFELSNMTATVEKEKTDFKAIGTRFTQSKTTGYKGTGSGTIRYFDPMFAKIMEAYAKTGKDVYFTITITNDDPGSSASKTKVTLYNCNIDSLDIAKLDIDSEILEQDIDFTFDKFDVEVLG